MNTPPNTFKLATAWWLPACAALLLAACGGNADPDAEAPPLAADIEAAAPLASATTTLELQADAGTELDASAAPQVRPSFHVAPVVLDEPDNSDATDHAASATRLPRTQVVPPTQAGLSTRGLTLQAIEGAARMRALDAGTDAGPHAAEGHAAPLATPSVVATYSPAQIRAAYGLPPLPPAGTTLTAAQAAQLGAGQTIYIVDAMHNPNAAAELAAFNQKFGLPTCTTKSIATNAVLPLPKAPSSGCEFSVVYNTAAGGMTNVAPAYESGWATEIALDVQWAHATAPLARIVLIEAADASINSLLGGVKLANAMGPGAVSMSFGANEGSYTASVDAAFTGNGMTYLAATGDWGAQVSWPSVSPKVLAVGGTTLDYRGSGTRKEVVWSGTGGGISAYTPTPNYQNANVPGMGVPARRSVADVAFNADPSTGQYTAVMAPGSSTVRWLSVGGTSLSTPQWAGLVAVANAMRLQAAKPVLGSPHAVLNGQIGAVPGTYAAAFADITAGNHGSCSNCSARIGYDAPTGLGTPNAGPLLATLSGSSAAATAPVVTPAVISGQAGKALSFTVSVSAPNAVTYTLSGAPAGMVVASTGAVSWPTPAAGSHAVTVTARDTRTGLAGQAVYTVQIAAAPAAAAPVVTGGTISGKPGVPLSYSVAVKAANAVTYSLAGAPAGMVMGSNGVLNWAKPVAGNYSVTVTALDGKTRLSGKGVISVTIANLGPTITAAPMVGKVGAPLAGTINIAAPGAAWVSVSISGAPMGMMFSVSGLSFTARWASPAKGSYSLKIVVADSTGKTATATVPVTIAAQ